MKKQIKQIILLLILVFLLNLFWEVSHSLLYDWNPTISSYIPVILRASFIDFIFITAIFLTITLKNKSTNWINKTSKLDYLIIISAGIAIAIIIEVRALTEGRWSYNSLMPTIFEIGISPLIQLALTSLIAVWLARSLK